MALAAAGFGDHPVVSRAVSFLLASARTDGSWPIDTDLDTYVTALAVEALTAGNRPAAWLERDQRERIAAWLIRQQHTQRHPFTRARPGGWAWTNKSGAVPDADDTAAVLVALNRLGVTLPKPAVMEGLRWLVRIQNGDGGTPTFCRGWGRLPFDRSCPELTARALRAFALWRPATPVNQRRGIDRAILRALPFLALTQNREGAWYPLWFGSQRVSDHRNPVCGTAMVVATLAPLHQQRFPGCDRVLRQGIRYLQSAQNQDGGWGAARGAESSLEETALALRALAKFGSLPSIARGAEWLLKRLNDGPAAPSPIGLYFASLWYSEKQYPPIFTVAALAAAEQALAGAAPAPKG